MSRRQQLDLNRPDSGARTAGGAEPTPADDTGCTILHVDMDAFYASVELLRYPDLTGTPVIVGGGGTRGVVLSATYEARRFGVHSAMPMIRARRLCPQATVLAPHHEDYTRISAGVLEIFRSITPLVEPLALDEAFLDVSGALRLHGHPARIGRTIRDRVADEQGITCSVGIATTKFVAKLATTRCKPDGLLVVPARDVIAFLHPLPVGALWGVGDKTEDSLLRLGLRTVGDIANTSRATLQRALGQGAGAHLHALSWGRDERTVMPHEPDKSIGAEETFSRDVDDPVVIRRELLRLSERTARRLRAGGLAGRTVSIKVRFADFTTITRARTLREATDVGRDVYTTARSLYEGLGLDRARIRLVGVRVEQLVDGERTPHQLLIDEPLHGWRDAERAADCAARRFGSGAVRPARLVSADARTGGVTDGGADDASRLDQPGSSGGFDHHGVGAVDGAGPAALGLVPNGDGGGPRGRRDR